MGNTPSHRGLATVAMAKYLHLTKRQVLKLRFTFDELSPGQTMISRKNFRTAISRAAIWHACDKEVLLALFTMWDVDGRGEILCKKFIAGISVLACPCETLQECILFAMKVVDLQNTGSITASELLMLLQGISVTMALFGDAALEWKQIHKIIDSVFETITGLSENKADFLSHVDCIKRLMLEPMVVKAAFNRLRMNPDEQKTSGALRAPSYGKKSFPASPANEDESDKIDIPCSARLGGTGIFREKHRPDRPQESSAQQVTYMSGSYTSTDVSSVALTPVNKIPVMLLTGLDVEA